MTGPTGQGLAWQCMDPSFAMCKRGLLSQTCSQHRIWSAVPEGPEGPKGPFQASQSENSTESGRGTSSQHRDIKAVQVPAPGIESSLHFTGDGKCLRPLASSTASIWKASTDLLRRKSKSHPSASPVYTPATFRHWLPSIGWGQLFGITEIIRKSRVFGTRGFNIFNVQADYHVLSLFEQIGKQFPPTKYSWSSIPCNGNCDIVNAYDMF